jgi:hypothetical protein
MAKVDRKKNWSDRGHDSIFTLNAKKNQQWY